MNNSRVLTNQQILATVSADGFYVDVSNGYVTLKRHGQKHKEFPLVPKLEDFYKVVKDWDAYYGPTYQFIACNWNGVLSQEEFKEQGVMSLCGSYKVIDFDDSGCHDEVCRWENTLYLGFKVGYKLCNGGAAVVVEKLKEGETYNVTVIKDGVAESRVVLDEWFEELVAGTNRITLLCVANRIVNRFEKEQINARS